MRRILVESARARIAAKRGGNREQASVDPDQLAAPPTRPQDDLLELDRALEKFISVDPVKANLVKLRYFAGLTLAEAAVALGLAHNTADRYWAYAKAWLH